MNRRSFLRPLGFGGSVAIFAELAGCTIRGDSPDDTAPVDGTLVEMTDRNTFEPATVRVPAAETVVWRNVGAIPHTVTAYGNEIPSEAAYFASGGFESEDAARDGYGRGDSNLRAGEQYEHTFAVPGRYEYFCIPHESGGMRGTVVVEVTSEGTSGTGNIVAQPSASPVDTRESTSRRPTSGESAYGAVNE